MARDDSKGSNEFGYPIQVVVGSYVDSADGQIRRMENYRLNDDLILEEGHQNLIFHKGDSLSLQLTYGMRDFLNKASDGRSMKFIMRLGYPFLQEKDTTYSDYVKTWKSLNTGVAAVSGNKAGKCTIVAKKAGKSTITATLASGKRIKFTRCLHYARVMFNFKYFFK